MTHRTTQPPIAGLHRLDALALAVLASAIFTLALLLGRELWAGALNRWEIGVVAGAGIAIGLVQLWMTARAVLALMTWAASGGFSVATLPWRVPIWWLGTIPAGWLGLVFPGHQHHPAVLVLSLVIIARAADALTEGVHALELRTVGARDP